MGDFSFSNYADEFYTHIEKSIRGYRDLREDMIALSKYFIEDNTTVLDIGCSQGTMLKSIKEHNSKVKNTKYIGIDIESSFKKHWKNEKNLQYLVEDVRTWEGMKNLSLAVSLFTMQFIPQRDRLNLLKKIFDNLIEGGAFIFSEKVFSDNTKVDDMMSSIYYDFKKQNFSEKQILDKEQELRSLAKLTNENILIKQLRSIGFRGVQQIWRNFNFVGFVALKLPKEQWGEVEDLGTGAPEGSTEKTDEKLAMGSVANKVDLRPIVPINKKTNRWVNLLPEDVILSILIEPDKNDSIGHESLDKCLFIRDLTQKWAKNNRIFPDNPELQKLFEDFSDGINEIRWGDRGYYEDIDHIPFDTTTNHTGSHRIMVLRDSFIDKIWDLLKDDEKIDENI